MASSSCTIATQTEEEEGDFSHLTAKDINFKCSEGIQARLDKFEVVSSKGLILRVELGGKLYNGFLIEAIDSFAPVKLTAYKRRHTTFHNWSKTRHTGVTRTKKYNVYSRKNFPRGYVDTYNTIEARLRYGRDKRIPSFNSSHAAGNSSSHSKDLRSNRKKKSKSVVVGLDSNDDSNFIKEYKTGDKYSKQTLKSNESDEASDTTSNENSSSTSSIFILDPSEEISEVSSDTSFSYSVTKIQYSQSKKDEKRTGMNYMCTDKAVQDQTRDFKTGPKYPSMVSSQKIISDPQCKNYDTPRRPISSKVSWCRTSEPNLIEFSPVVNTGKGCQEGHESVQSVATLLPPSEPDLISFSPEVRFISPQMLKVIDDSSF